MTSSFLLVLLCACALLSACAAQYMNYSSSSMAPPPNSPSYDYDDHNNLIDPALTHNEVVIAPSEILTVIGDLETREQGSTAWICSKLDSAMPWIAYSDIRSYIEGGNSLNKDYTGMVLYPVMELTHTSAEHSKLCVYLPSVDHCFPPKPLTKAIIAVKQLMKRTYYAIRFWGQASDMRVNHYKHLLERAISGYQKSADMNLFYLSYFPDHVREVRYDHTTTPSNGTIHIMTPDVHP